MESILTSIKKLLGIMDDYEHFDTDIIIHINTVLSTLRQLGVGPKEGYRIKDKSGKWSDFIDSEDLRFEDVKTFIYFKVKLIFDPPTASSAIEAMNRAISELEWRLNATAESTES